MGLKVAVLVHNFAEDESIGKGRSFRKQKIVFLFFGGFFPEEGPGVKGIELECESPSFGIGVVFLENVNPTDIFPEIDWFFDGRNIEEAEKSGLTSS